MADLQFCIINENCDPEGCGFEEYNKWVNADSPGKVVAKTFWLSGDYVSTCFVNEMCVGSPFETMIRLDDDDFHHCKNRQDALRQHMFAVGWATHLLKVRPSQTIYRKMTMEDAQLFFGDPDNLLIPA